MKKKPYLKPDITVHQVKTAAILAGSMHANTNTQGLETESGPTEGDDGKGNYTW